MSQMLSRRFVLRATGALALTGLAGAAAWQFRPTTPPDLMRADLPVRDGRRMLVTYDTMMGSTGEQALWLAQQAQAAGFDTILRPVAEAPAPGGFDAVIMGSAIRGTSWLPGMLEWAGAHAETLAAMPVALFQGSMQCAGFLAADNRLSQAQTEMLQRDLAPLFARAPGLRPKPVGFFPGRVNYDHLPPMIRLSYPLVSWTTMIGDYRQPDRVAGFGRQVLPALAKGDLDG